MVQGRHGTSRSGVYTHTPPGDITTGLPPGERVIIDSRPHVAFVFTQMWRWFIVGLVAWGAMRWAGMLWGQPLLIVAANGALLIVLVRFMAGLFDWYSRRHVLTDSRILARSGVLRSVCVEIPLRRVQHTILVRPAAERLLGIGSLGVTSAGTGGVDLVWRGVEHPQAILDTIREQVERMSPQGPGKQVTPVIGIVGGIGAGKSTVARAFADLGCVVSDSDASVRELLHDRAVIAQLVKWWGKEVLRPDGTIDRAAVAGIVFESPFERRKLEGLIHPLVHERRRELIREAADQGVEGVIIDAPLLFEAGVDSECDAVVFVDTPKEVRLARVGAGRGWSKEELDKREKTQLGLEQKRERSDYVVANSGLPEELRGRVARVLASIQQDLRKRALGG
ncbi:MAG: dephospho-CoA kinase [Phycisphaerales bacterium]